MSTVKCFFAAEIAVRAYSRCRAHTHPCTELVLNLDCRGELFHGKKPMLYDHGDLVVYQPGETHWINNDTAGLQLCIGVNGCGAHQIPICVLKAPENTKKQCLKILEISKGYAVDKQIRLDLLVGLFVLDLLRMTGTKKNNPQNVNQAVKAKEMIDTRFHEQLSVKSMASALFISPDYLRQLFKGSFGDSPMHYLIRTRIEHACQLLHMTDLPVQQIARQCGIENAYYFSRLFKKITGTTPSRYRANR